MRVHILLSDGFANKVASIVLRVTVYCEVNSNEYLTGLSIVERTAHCHMCESLRVCRPSCEVTHVRTTSTCVDKELRFSYLLETLLSYSLPAIVTFTAFYKYSIVYKYVSA